jgi:hypothetical protein
MDVVMCFGILAIASDARCGAGRLSGLVSAQQTTARQADPLSSATLHSGIFVGVGYTGLQAQTRWKRQRRANELLSATTYSLSSGVQEQKSSGFGFCKSVIGICFSVFKVRYNRTALVRHFSTLNSSL